MDNTIKKTREILSKYNLKADKRYGQNFLVNDKILQNIVDVANLDSDDLVIEIGPGLGNLTEYLFKTNAYPLLIEIDDKMIEVIKDRFNDKEFTLLNADILKTNIDDLVEQIEKTKQVEFSNVKVVANLPYYITSPIIFKLLQDSKRINEIIIMIQKEVADRIIAIPKTKEYGILSIMTRYYAKASIEIEVSSSNFIPSPDVNSSVIKLTKQNVYNVENERLLFELIHKSFAQRRKKISNSLSATNFNNMKKEEIEKLLEKSKIDRMARAEELSINEYISIVENIK